MMNRSHIAAELPRLIDILRWGYSQFNASDIVYGHGTDSAWDEVVMLALHILHLPEDTPTDLFTVYLTQSEREAILAIYERRIQECIPAAYLMRSAYFAGLPFYVDERVLIPRSPIAELIEQQFQPWIQPERVHRILDLCTGSGCIAIACAHAFPTAQVDATDISQDALAVAQINQEKHGLSDQLHLYESDVWDGLDPSQTYDIIVSNPPYVDAEDMASLPKEYEHEPRLGLAAGTDGLDIVKRILAQAAQHLTAQGILIIEVGNSAEALMEQYPEWPFLWLSFERGGDGVFLLTREQLIDVGKQAHGR